jgi:hypothetical protein
MQRTRRKLTITMLLNNTLANSNDRLSIGFVVEDQNFTTNAENWEEAYNHHAFIK